MRYDAEVKAVLWASIEDFAGLWEVEWELNTLHPDGSNRRAALSIVEGLLAAGMIKAFRSSSLDGDPLPVDDAEALDILRDERSWDPAGLDSCEVWRIGATEQGAAFYEAL